MSDFSIDYILNRAGQQYIGTNASLGLIQRLKLNGHLKHPNDDLRHHPYVNCLPQNDSEHKMDTNFASIPMFDWLQYTRYHPPKLPRTFRPGPAKRTPGRLPRIPFSPAQLQALEDAYKNSNYLSAEEANRLAESLDLTNTRVKIWFQNRRARQRRERLEKDESYASTISSNASSPEPDQEQEHHVDIVSIST